MARKHTFFIVVLLAAAALAGFAAFARNVDLSQPATATATPTLPAGALRERLRALDRFEAKLRKRLDAKPAAAKASPTAVVTRVAAAAPVSPSGYDDDHEDEDEEHEDDDD
jgi:hypothetical protein